MSDFLPIDDIETNEDPLSSAEGVIPKPLVDDPDIGDGSSGREGYSIASWRLHTLRRDTLVGMTEYEGDDWASRSARRAQEASRNARTKEERQARKVRRVKVGFALVAILAVIAAVGATYAIELWGGKSVPNVEGFTQSVATQTLEERGFTVELKAAPADSLEGRVVTMTPHPGTRVDEGSSITLVIGQTRVLPDVTGKTEEEARKALEEAGAKNVRAELRIKLEEEEGLVDEMQPPAGSVFISTEEVVLFVTQLPRVPDVMSMDEASATRTMQDMGLPSHVTYERGSVEERLKILRTEPATGERIEVGQDVNIVVGDPLIDVLRLSDYYDAPMPRIREFVESEGYALKVATRNQDNHLVARFDSATYDAQLSFQWKPWTREAEKATGIADVLGSDAPVEGVRLSIAVNRAQSGAATPKGLQLLGIDYAYIDESTAQTLIDLCGFGEIEGSCTQDTIWLPQGTARGGHSFYCCYGEMGDFIWTILVAGADGRATEASRVVATCVPKTFFQTTDMADMSEAIANYVAYMDEYAT